MTLPSSHIPQLPEPITLLGSTGSIGTQTLDVVRRFPDLFKVQALAAGQNLEQLAQQITEFAPHWVSIQDPKRIDELRQLVPHYTGQIVCGNNGLNELACLPEISTVIVGLVGMTGLAPTLSAIKAGKKVLTANKETFVAGGHLVQDALAHSPYQSATTSPQTPQVIPIDSEHSAIFQCLKNEPPESVRTLILTASGGPFRNHSQTELQHVTLQQALKHPNWTMGQKVTIDSATMMNKGLEVIEAHWLFNIAYNKIQIIVHPQSIIHSGIEFVDGSVITQWGAPDMHVPIQVAMSYPRRLDAEYTAPNSTTSSRLNLLELSQLDLQPVDMERFPCVRLAYEAGQLGGSATTVLNAADEIAVDLFLKETIAYTDIPRIIEATLEAHRNDNLSKTPSLDDVIAVDQWARQYADSLLISSGAHVTGT